jgi:hypothetical protein
MKEFVWDYCPNCFWFGRVRKAYRFCDRCGWEYGGWGRRQVVLRLEKKAPIVAPLQVGSSQSKGEEKGKIDEVEEILKGHKACVTGT